MSGSRIFGEVLHDVVSAFQLLEVHDGHREPLAKEAGAHRRGALVQRLDEGDEVESAIAVRIVSENRKYITAA